MSKDPNKPDPDQEKKAPKPPRNSTEATEVDLWDLDDDNSGFIPHKAAPEIPEGLPSRRNRESNIRSKVPTERNIVVPELAPAVEPEAPEPWKPLSVARREVEPNAEGIDPPENENADAVPYNLPLLPSLTKSERIAIPALAAALILAAVLAAVHFSNSVPTRSPIADKTDFPVSGKLIEIRSATTYWKKPVTTGANSDTVRRGTALIPVVRLGLQAKSGAIRVFFRDTDGIVIGDAINRNASGDQDLVIPATAGFDDIGMHAAYRTGEQEPWTVQVFEGPSLSADRKEFRKVFETQISTDLR